MNIEFNNGASVHEIWGTLSDGTLIAAFQYERDGKLFAERRLAEDAENGPGQPLISRGGPLQGRNDPLPA